MRNQWKRKKESEKTGKKWKKIYLHKREKVKKKAQNFQLKMFFGCTLGKEGISAEQKNHLKTFYPELCNYQFW